MSAGDTSGGTRAVLAAALVAIGLTGAPARAESPEDAIGKILKELGVESGRSPAAEASAPLAPGSQFTEAQRAEIEEIVDLALARRGLLSPDGTGTIAPSGAMLDATMSESLFAVLNRFGSAELAVDGAGAPYVLGEMDGVRYRLDFIDCETGQACRDVIFTALYAEAQPSLDVINAWNRENRYGVAYLDADGAAWLKMTVNLHGGVSEENWADTVDWWRIAAYDFGDLIFKR